jgi:hypothetical protein
MCGDLVAKACENVDPESLKNPVFFFNDLVQDSNVITLGYASSTSETPDL